MDKSGETTYSTNGKAIYQICMKSGEEGLVTDFLSPDELWNKTFSEQNNWSNPLSRKILLENLDAAGFPKDDLLTW